MPQEKKNLSELVNELPEEVRAWFLAIHGDPARYHFTRILKDVGPENFAAFFEDHKEEYEFIRRF